MEHQDSINKMFKTGRYECDVQFYKHLLLWAQALDLYEYIEKIKENMNLVNRIA